MRHLTRFILSIFSSLGGGPLATGFELPGAPGPAPYPKKQPVWIPMSKPDFKFCEQVRAEVERVRNTASRREDWEQVFQILSKLYDHPDLQGAILAVYLNNLAVAAYNAGRTDTAQKAIRKAKSIQVAYAEINNAVSNNMGIFG